VRFDLTSLQVFVAVAEELSLTRAARREHLALSAVSKRIRELEETFGSPLLQRQARGVTPTAAGLSLLHYSRQIIHTLHRIEDELSEYAKGIKGHIRLHANTSSITEFLPAELDAFLTQHPLVKIDLEEQVGPAIVRAVLEEAADIGIIADNTPAPELQIFPYHTDRLVAVVPERHSLAQSKSVRLMEILDFDFVGPHIDSSLHALIMRAAMEIKRSVKLRFQVRSFDGICRMIRANLGVGILPALAIEPEVRSIGLRGIPLDEGWALRHLQLCVREFDSLPAIARELVQHLSSSGTSVSIFPRTSRRPK
jgi:DNA-binding transcriptional LysR family regulator